MEGPAPGSEHYAEALRRRFGAKAEDILDLASSEPVNINVFPNFSLLGNHIQVFEPISVDETDVTWYGTAVVDEDGTTEERSWWDPWDAADPLEGLSDDEYGRRVLSELRTSVELRKMSDVPVGVFLSGGIDSSTNAALFAEGEQRPVRTFSIGYDNDYASYPTELVYARGMAAEIGAEHHERIVSLDDLLAFLPEMVRLQDEPIADPVSVPLFYLSELARRNGVIVCQAGEGADELFCGYPSWHTHLRLQRADDLPVPAFAKRAGLAALAVAGRDRTRPYEFLRRGAAGLPVFWGGAEAFTERQKRRLLPLQTRLPWFGFNSRIAMSSMCCISMNSSPARSW